MTTSAEIKSKLLNFFSDENKESTGIHIQRDSIDETTLATYIYSCYIKNQDKQQDYVCYLIDLSNPINNINSDEIRNSLFDKNINYSLDISYPSNNLLIEYISLGNKVVISSIGN